MAWTFLIVDDCEGDAAQLGRSLQGLGLEHEVLIAANAGAAIELMEARQLRPSLVFASYALPGMNGIELLSEMRRRHDLARVPVVIASATISDREVVACYRLGVAAVLTKPVRAFELREAVRAFARPAERGAAPIQRAHLHAA